MKTEIFNNKKIKIREISKEDLKNVKKFQDFINSLEEIAWLKEKLNQIKTKRVVALIAEDKNKIISSVDIKLGWGRENHVGHYGIAVRKGYRNIGLGTYLTKEVIKLAKNKLKPRPKIIRLSVYSINKPAIEFYRNLGFREVAKIPKQGEIKGKLVTEVIMLLEL